MTILVAPKRWQRTKALASIDRSPDLTVEEMANLRAALHFLRKRLSGARKLALALRVNESLVDRALLPRSKPSVGLALRAARLAGVSVEDVLTGAWPPAGACPYCGRCGDPTDWSK